MVYTFTIQVSGGVDARYTLTSPLWPTAATGVIGSAQQTSTLTLILNGLEAQATSGISMDVVTNPLAQNLPVITVSTGRRTLAVAPASPQRRSILLYPPPLKPLGPATH
jgi:hypothetical protein